DLLRHGAGLFLLQPVDHHLRPFANKGQRDGFADPGVRTCDESNLVLQTHVFLQALSNPLRQSVMTFSKSDFHSESGSVSTENNSSVYAPLYPDSRIAFSSFASGISPRPITARSPKCLGACQSLTCTPKMRGPHFLISSGAAASCQICQTSTKIPKL